MEAAYGAADLERFAAWVHETDTAMAAELVRRGYALAETTLAMGMELRNVRVPRPALGTRPATWAEYLQVEDLPPGLLTGVEPSAFHVVVGLLDGEPVAAGLGFDLDGDRGIYNVGTKEHARRRGLGTAVTAALLHDARDRGCRTASIQSTAMAEGIYAAVGFRGLGRILEFAPA